MHLLEADHILIPLLDGRHALAQVAFAEDTYGVLHLSNRIANTDTKITALLADEILAVVHMNFETLPDGHWPITGYAAITRGLDVPINDDPLDPAVVEAFANAIHGLYPWDGFPDPAYFTTLLRDPDTLPDGAIHASDLPAPDHS